MDNFVWVTFVRLQGISDLRLHNLTVDRLRSLTDFGQIQDLIDMDLMFIDDTDGGVLVVVAHFTEDLALFVEGELHNLAMDRERPGGYRGKRAERLVGAAAFIPPGATIH